jgi:hypothetical protein
MTAHRSFFREMTMTRLHIVVPVMVSLVAACAERTPTAPEAAIGAFADGSALAARGGSARPFGGRCDTEITVLAPLPADPPNLQRLHIDYECQLQHLGHTTASNEQIVTFTSPTTGTSSNTTTYTAANGDQLFSTWTGMVTANGPDVIFSGPETYSGGTGRFTNASGSSFISGNGSFATRTAQFTMTGTLSY